MMRCALCLTACSLAVLVSSLLAAPAGLNARFGLPEEFAWGLRPVATSPARQNRVATDAPDILSAGACHAGAQRLLFRIGFAEPPAFASSHFILYLDLDNDPGTGRADASHRGIDLMVAVGGDSVQTSPRNPSYGKAKVAGWVEGCDLWLAVDAPLKVADGEVEFGMHLLSERKGGAGDSTPHAVVRVPAGTLDKPGAGELGRGSSLRALSDYRYHNDQVKLLPLADKEALGQGRGPGQAGRAAAAPIAAYRERAPRCRRQGRDRKARGGDGRHARGGRRRAVRVGVLRSASGGGRLVRSGPRRADGAGRRAGARPDGGDLPLAGRQPALGPSRLSVAAAGRRTGWLYRAVRQRGHAPDAAADAGRADRRPAGGAGWREPLRDRCPALRPAACGGFGRAEGGSRVIGRRGAGG